MRVKVRVRVRVRTRDGLRAGRALLEVTVTHDLQRVVTVELRGRRAAAARPHLCSYIGPRLH